MVVHPAGTGIQIFIPTGAHEDDYPDAIHRLRKRERPHFLRLSTEDRVTMLEAQQGVTLGTTDIIDIDLKHQFLSTGPLTLPMHCRAVCRFKYSTFAHMPRVREFKERMLESVRQGIWSHENPTVSTTQLPVGFFYPVSVVAGLRGSLGVIRITNWNTPAVAEVEIFVADDSVCPLENAQVCWEGVHRNGEKYTVNFATILNLVPFEA